jgi:surfeit locus 1 family protein
MTASTTRPLRWTDWLFAVLMLVLAAVCAFLGAWQMDRLAEKDALVAAVDARLTSAPIPVPAVDQWSSLDYEALVFQPVSLTGAYRYTQTLTVFTSLSNANGQYGGPGFWVMTPFELEEGGTVFVNRGFVPQQYQEAAAIGDLHGEDPGMVTIGSSGCAIPRVWPSWPTPTLRRLRRSMSICPRPCRANCLRAARR